MTDKTFIFHGLTGHIEGYEKEYGRKPDTIALGKTHIEDLHDYLQDAGGKLLFEGIEVIQHNDPMGITLAHRNDN